MGAFRTVRSFRDKVALIVDDDPGMRCRIREALRAPGLALVDAVDDSEAIRKCRQLRFDLIVMRRCSPDAALVKAVIALRMADPQHRVIVVVDGRRNKNGTALRQLDLVARVVHLDGLCDAVRAELGITDVADNLAD